MHSPELVRILSQMPLFESFSPSQLRYVERYGRLIEFKKNNIIYSEGSAPCAFYYVVSGRVVISAADGEGREKTLEYLHRGQYFGIISLLTGDAHSVTARAVNDCLLLVIPKTDFPVVLKKIPWLAIHLSQTLSRRLKRKDIHPKTIFESTVITVFGISPQIGTSLYAFNLALSMFRETGKSVIYLLLVDEKNKSSLLLPGIPPARPLQLQSRGHGQPGSIREHIVKSREGVDILVAALDNAKESSGINHLLSLLINDYHYIVLDLPYMPRKQALRLLSQADLIHLVVSAARSSFSSGDKLAEKLERNCPGCREKTRIILNQSRSASLLPLSRSLFSKVYATIPRISEPFDRPPVICLPESPYSKTLKRIARQEGNCQLGLALGVGMAYGLCHIGVLKVFEEEKIQVDVISGASMGALIAALWACGNSSEQILSITSQLKEPSAIWGLVDFTFPLSGFIKGKKLYRFLKQHFGRKTFFDIKVPLKIIASDIKAKESRVLDSGLLVDAIMASCSMPGVFTPFFLKDQMLLDGGIVNPLPTEPLSEIGVKKIIAVNVTPSKEDIIRHYEGMRGKPVRRGGLMQSLNPLGYLRERLKNNILEIIFDSIEILQSEVAKKEAKFADLVLHPDISGMHWLELHRAEEFALRGEQEARRHLEEIRRIVKE